VSLLVLVDDLCSMIFFMHNDLASKGSFKMFMLCSWYLSGFSIKVVMSSCHLVSLDFFSRNPKEGLRLFIPFPCFFHLNFVEA
jgi:hypothetical protein